MSVLILIGGLAIALTAVFADRLGIDPSAGWGRSRTTLLLGGLILLIVGALPWVAPAPFQTLWRRLAQAAAQITRHSSIVEPVRVFRTYWPALPIIAVIILVYVWLVSAGTWFVWSSPTAYYVDLARGFQHGHLYMDIKVPPGLLTSPDPYTPLPNGATQGPTDLSYYNGRLYLPWGPAPALVVLFFRWLFHWWLGDLQLTFIFLSGLFLAECALLLFMWDGLFRPAPKWLLWLSILLVGLAGPVPFMLSGHAAGRIYEAAVSGGQFFAISGMLLAVISVQRRWTALGLALAGLLWTFSIGTRPNLVLPIGLLVIVISAWLLALRSWSLKALAELAPFFLILALGGACLAWYNWARFGSSTETGYYYQLAGLNLRQRWSYLFSAAYIPQNVFNYLLELPRVEARFPFLSAAYGHNELVLSALAPSSYYLSQMITGLACLATFSIFAIIPFAFLVQRWRHGPAAPHTRGSADPRFLNWIALTLGSNFLGAFAFLMVFFWASMRYMEDFLPPLIVLSALGFWQGYDGLARHKSWRRPYAVLGILLAVISISVSVLIALSSNDARLFLTSLFSR